jgi:hypothetical protein
MQAQQHHRADEHHHRGQQHQQQYVMPIGGETLHAMKSAHRHVAHDAKRHRHDAPPRQVAQDHHRKAERGHAHQRSDCAAHGGWAQRQRIDEPAGVQRNENFRQRGQRNRGGDAAHERFAAGPAADGE